MPAPVYPSPVYSMLDVAISISPTMSQAGHTTSLKSGVMPSWQFIHATTGVIDGDSDVPAPTAQAASPYKSGISLVHP